MTPHEIRKEEWAAVSTITLNKSALDEIGLYILVDLYLELVLL